MGRKIAYDVVVRHQETDKEYRHEILADDEPSARKAALEKGRRALATTMAELTYGTFQVVSCVSSKQDEPKP